MTDLATLHPKVFRLGAAGGKGVSETLFPLGLGEKGVHEVCETGFGDMGALTGFVLAAASIRPGVVAWISQQDMTREHGGIMAAGQAFLRRNQRPVLSVSARRSMDVLWALEEVVCSSAVSLAVAEVGAVDFTASRRLQLAAERHGVPVVLMLPYTTEGATAASARWRIRPEPSAPNRYDSRALGNTRWSAVLERSRLAPEMVGRRFNLEVDDETLSLRVVPGLAAHAPASQPAWTVEGDSAPRLGTG